jgi:hypothetical protein
MPRFTLTGVLHRIEITLLRDKTENGEHGSDLPLEVTAFFPDPNQGFQDDFLPYSYLGMHCCLERVRFGIDPSQGEDRFYFGAQP